jgi:regulatory protein YycH of two-component signal transduction system YycFG
LKQTLFTASSLMEQLRNTTDYNSENIDQILVDLRVTSENLKQLTDTVKTKPSSLIRGSNVADRQPGTKE